MAASSAQSLISPEGLRQDGRRVGEIRRLRCRLGAAPRADGSAYVEMGNTKVLATVCGPHEARRPGEQLDCAALTCELSALPFAGGAHRPQGRGDRGSVELAAGGAESPSSVTEGLAPPLPPIREGEDGADDDDDEHAAEVERAHRPIGSAAVRAPEQLTIVVDAL